MSGLTHQQARMLDAIRDLSQGGVSPSFSELAERVGLASRGRVHVIITALKQRGYVDLIPNARRSIRIIEEAQSLERYSTEALRAVRSRIDEIIQGRGEQ